MHRDLHVEVGDQLLDDHQLLIIFLSHHDVRGMGQIEQLRDHRGHTDKVAIAVPFEPLGDGAGVDHCPGPVRVHVLSLGREREGHAFLTKDIQVTLQRHGVFFEVIGVIELGWVHENRRRHHGPGKPVRCAEKSTVTRVQGPHGGDKNNTLPRFTQRPRCCCECLGGIMNTQLTGRKPGIRRCRHGGLLLLAILLQLFK